MRTIAPWNFALFVVAAILPGLSWANTTSNDKTNGLAHLLDATQPAAERAKVFAHYKQKALDGDKFAQYIVGSLYSVGGRLRGNPAPRDVDSARRYLSNAAANGYLTAMAKMAELELAERRPLQAMIWAQLYGHYTLNPVAGKKIDEDKASGYFANLLHRADVAFDKKQDMTMRNDVAAFIFLHDKQIRAGMAGGEIKSESPAHSGETTRQTYAPKTGRAPGVHNDELAEFLVAFAANGHATQAWLIDAVPDFDSGSKIANIAERVRVNAIPAGADTRYGVVPILYTFRRYKIK